jgi:uncharacterized protein DUF1876
MDDESREQQGGGEAPEWTVTIRFEEDGVRTAAHLTLKAANRELKARGTARRSPLDPSLPQVGEDLAVARALSHLAHELLGDATRQLEEATHRPSGIADRAR